MKKIVVLGAGLVGKAIAIDLAKSFDVTTVDINHTNLEAFENHKNIKTILAIPLLKAITTTNEGSIPACGLCWPGIGFFLCMSTSLFIHG